MGTKQGDPLSSLLFNAVLQDIVDEVRPRWVKLSHGLFVGPGPEHLLSILRFADDCLLLAPSAVKLERMTEAFAIAAKKRGLEIHPEKTKAFTNATKGRGRPQRTSLRCMGDTIEILPVDGHVKYLGRQLCFEQPTEVEVDNRISQAWKRFMANREEFTDRRTSVNMRLKLFDGTVAATMLYGTEAWTMTTEQASKVRRAQRRMLRLILGHGRRKIEGGEVEPWHEWVQRATAQAEARLLKLGLKDWVTTHYQHKWRWACKIASMDTDRWAWRAAAYTPEFELRSQRDVGHPHRRWSDQITSFLISGGIFNAWWDAARDSAFWQSLEDAFVNSCHAGTGRI